MEKQLPQQGNLGPLAPNLGAWTGELKPVKLNHRYTGGKLADMPMYGMPIDKTSTQELNKRTIVQNLRRGGSCQ
jgi:hypothetical protein